MREYCELFFLINFLLVYNREAHKLHVQPGEFSQNEQETAPEVPFPVIFFSSH